MKPDDIYELWPLNVERIAKYQKLAKDYNIDEGIVRDIFCKGAEWGIEVSNKEVYPICQIKRSEAYPNECDHPENRRRYYDGGSSWCDKCWSYVDLPQYKSRDNCKFIDCAQGRFKCTNPKSKYRRCKEVCDKYEERSI